MNFQHDIPLLYIMILIYHVLFALVSNIISFYLRVIYWFSPKHEPNSQAGQTRSAKLAYFAFSLALPFFADLPAFFPAVFFLAMQTPHLYGKGGNSCL